MAVNKNFVVKNGIEVATNLIVADPINNRVGLGTTAPEALLDVRGPVEIKDGPSQIAAVDIAGITTVREDFSVGVGGTVVFADAGNGKVGLLTALPSFSLDVQQRVGSADTAVARFGGNVVIDGNINGASLNVSGITTTIDLGVTRNFNVSGLTTTFDLGVTRNFSSSGITTLASSGGITTTGGDLYVGGNLNVIGDITYDEVRGRNINITGVTTLGTVQISSGIVTATTGVVTYFGDGSNLTGIATELVATIGISSGGTQIGSAVTMIDFAGTNAVITATPTDSGISTVTIQPSVSLGLVIALGA
jgi:hypothetical protein